MKIPFISSLIQSKIDAQATQKAERMFREKQQEEKEKKIDTQFNINCFYLGMPVIMIPDDTGSVILGIITGWHENADSVPIIRDYIENKKVIAMCSYQAFTEQRLEALYKLDPSERFAICYNNCHGHNGKPYQVSQEGKWLTIEETREVARKNGFYEEAEKYWSNFEK